MGTNEGGPPVLTPFEERAKRFAELTGLAVGERLRRDGYPPLTDGPARALARAIARYSPRVVEMAEEQGATRDEDAASLAWDLAGFVLREALGLPPNVN